MSNESENKRIELTEFEGLGKGEQHPKHLFEEVEKRFNDGGVKTQPLYLDEAFVNAIIMLPDLITELKRCYELIDRLQMHVDPAWKTYDKQVNAKYSNNEASE